MGVCVCVRERDSEIVKVCWRNKQRERESDRQWSVFSICKSAGHQKFEILSFLCCVPNAHYAGKAKKKNIYLLVGFEPRTSEFAGSYIPQQW